MDRTPPRPPDAPPRFPRRRGDGPAPAAARWSRAEFPPQARGWTGNGVLVGLVGGVSPAGAGMDRSWTRRRSSDRRFPRRRGDGPGRRTEGRSCASFPPQARGWTPNRRMDERRLHVSPAGAGMDLSEHPHPAPSPRFPRRRGDGPTSRRSPRRVASFPPQARGWTLAVPPVVELPEVSPAGAGMDLPPTPGAHSHARFPRRRGDGPAGRGVLGGHAEFPPQARGWTPGRRLLFGPEAVSPAGAGMDRPLALPPVVPSCFPRRRGDGPLKERRRGGFRPFPPQARGWTGGRGGFVHRPDVSPAGAGMDRDGSRTALAGESFPRRRGDGPPNSPQLRAQSMFPPQARGWTPPLRLRLLRRPVSPAGAGMDPGRRRP